MNITLDDANIRAIMTQVIMEHLTPAKREELIKSAIVTLVTPKPVYDGARELRAPLQEAFERAFQALANEEAKKFLQDDPTVRKQLQELLAKGWERLVSRGDPIIERIANHLAEAMRLDR